MPMTRGIVDDDHDMPLSEALKELNQTVAHLESLRALRRELAAKGKHRRTTMPNTEQQEERVFERVNVFAGVKNHTVTVNDHAVAVLTQHREGHWFTSDSRETNVPGFRKFKVDAGNWGDTVDEATDAIYAAIEVQCPEFLVEHLSKTDVTDSCPVAYSYLDQVGKVVETTACCIHLDSVTGHWATEFPVQQSIHTTRDDFEWDIKMFVPCRLWGRDKHLAITRIVAYVDGFLEGQERAQLSQHIEAGERRRRDKATKAKRPDDNLDAEWLVEAVEDVLADYRRNKG